MSILVAVKSCEVSDAFAKAAQAALAFEGMLDLKLYRKDDDATRFVFIEKWGSRARSDAFMARQKAAGTVKHLEALLTEPVSTVYCEKLS